MADIFHSTKLIKTRKKPFLYCFAFLLYITCISPKKIIMLMYDYWVMTSQRCTQTKALVVNSKWIPQIFNMAQAQEKWMKKKISKGRWEGTSTIIWCKLRAKVFMYDHNTKNSMQFAYNIPYIMREWAKILRNSSRYEKKKSFENHTIHVHVPFCLCNTFFFIQIHFSCAILKICEIHF